MVHSGRLLELVEAERRGDRAGFRALVEQVIADERAACHHLLADRLAEILAAYEHG